MSNFVICKKRAKVRLFLHLCKKSRKVLKFRSRKATRIEGINHMENNKKISKILYIPKKSSTFVGSICAHERSVRNEIDTNNKVQKSI